MDNNTSDVGFEEIVLYPSGCPCLISTTTTNKRCQLGLLLRQWYPWAVEREVEHLLVDRQDEQEAKISGGGNEKREVCVVSCEIEKD